MMLTTERLTQMHALLTAMGRGGKLATDGLGLYLGDGVPRAGLGGLRSNELKALVEEVQAARQKQNFEWALDALIEVSAALNADQPEAASKVIGEALWSRHGA